MNTINQTIYHDLDLMPEDLQGWNGDSEVFGALIDEIRPELIIEVGTWKGLSAITMAKHIKKINLNSNIVCVDTWLGALEFWTTLKDSTERNLLLKNGYPQIYYQFLSNVVHNQVQDIILPFPNTSQTAADYFRATATTSKLIYIDGSHKERDVYDDLQAYFGLLEDGGIIFGDDYFAWEGVRLAVVQFAKDRALSFDIREDNFWIIRK